MRYRAVLNRDGGTLRSLDIDALCAEAETVFARHGHALDCRVVPGAGIASALEAAATDPDIDVVLAGGGDGTVSAAAAQAFETGRTLAVLPAGTMNLFARALGLPLDIHDAIAAIAAGRPARIDVATANGVVFVHHFGVGIHARLVRIRDGLHYSSAAGKMLASLRAVSAAIIDPPRFSVEIITPRGGETREISGLAVSNNPIAEGHVPHADALDKGVLGVYMAAPMRPAALARLLVEVMMGTWHANPLVSEREVSAITLRFANARRRRLHAVIDGELTPLAQQVKITLHPGALSVIAPSDPA